MPIDRMPSQFCFEKSFDIKFPQQTRLGGGKFIPFEEDTLIIFTDGSKIDVGSRALVFCRNELYDLAEGNQFALLYGFRAIVVR